MIQQNIAHFDVSVHYLVWVKFSNAYDELCDDGSCVLLAQALFVLLLIFLANQRFLECSTTNELHDKVEALFAHVAVLELAVWVVEVVEEDLVFQQHGSYCVGI